MRWGVGVAACILVTSCTGNASPTPSPSASGETAVVIKRSAIPKASPSATVRPSSQPTATSSARPRGPVVRGPWGIVPSARGTDDPATVIQAEQGLALTIQDAKGVWTQKPPLMRPRAGLCAGVIDGRIVLAEGDHRPGMEVLSDQGAIPLWFINDSYDSELQPAGAEEANTLHQGHYLAVGGVYQKELWTAGGLRGQFNADGSSGRANVFVYTTEGFRLSREGEGPYILRQARRAACGGVVGDQFIIAGGVFKASAGAVTAVEIINLKKAGADAQTIGAKMPLAVAGAASAVTADRLYVVGGYIPELVGGKAVKVVQVYDPKTDTWLRSGDAGAPPELPLSLHSASAGILDDVLYVVGGQSENDTILETVYKLNLKDPKATWQPGVSLTTARALSAMVTYQGAIWAIGGMGEQRSPLSSVEAFTP